MSNRRIPIHNRSGSGVRLVIHISDSLFWKLCDHRDNFMVRNKLGDPADMPLEMYIPCLLSSIKEVSGDE